MNAALFLSVIVFSLSSFADGPPVLKTKIEFKNHKSPKLVEKSGKKVCEGVARRLKVQDKEGLYDGDQKIRCKPIIVDKNEKCPEFRPCLEEVTSEEAASGKSNSATSGAKSK